MGWRVSFADCVALVGLLLHLYLRSEAGFHQNEEGSNLQKAELCWGFYFLGRHQVSLEAGISTLYTAGFEPLDWECFCDILPSSQGEKSHPLLTREGSPLLGDCWPLLRVAREFNFGAVVSWKPVCTQKSDSPLGESKDSSKFSLHPSLGVSSDDLRT